MPLQSLVLALTLISVGFLSRAHAYPGARASDYQQTLEIKSTCASADGHRNDILFGYTSTAIKRGPKGECPAEASVALRAYPQQQPAIEVAKDTGSEVIFAGSQDINVFRIWSIDHEIRMLENGQLRFANNITEAAYTQQLATLKTASNTHPVILDVDYALHKVTRFMRTPSANEKTLKIIAACTSKKGHLYGYVETGAPKSADECPEVYQVVLKRDLQYASVAYYHQYVWNPYGSVYSYQLEIDSVEILSRFGVPLFSIITTPGAATKARLDFRTASPENPVNVIVNETTKSILSIEPSISPYTL